MTKKVAVYALNGKAKQKIELPAVFSTEFRPDLIKRAVLSEQSYKYQPHGTNPLAGTLVAASSWGVGRGAARLPRRHGRQTSHANRGAIVTNTVGGRSVHAPRAEKILIERINKKEHEIALKSAIAATANKEIVQTRGHKVENIKDLPLIIVDEFETIMQTKQAIKALTNIGLEDELERTRKVRKRAGIGKLRGRRKRYPKGPLLVVADKNAPVKKAARNIPGVNVLTVSELNVEELAPGTHPGRLVIWTKGAIDQLSEE